MQRAIAASQDRSCTMLREPTDAGVPTHEKRRLGGNLRSERIAMDNRHGK